MGCPACLAADPRPWATKSGHPLWRCRRCGSLFASPEGTDAETDDLYGRYYDRPLGEVAPVVVESLTRIVRGAEPFRSTGRWLDIGYGEGAILTVASRHGWRCHGTELAPAVLERGRAQGWVVSATTTDAALFPPQGFDVVTLIETLEHVPEPRSFLADAARLLRPGGLLFLTTPNAGSLNRRLLGPAWSVVCPPEHLTLWTARALRVACGSLGFAVERLRREGLNPVEILARVRKAEGPPVHRNEAALALNTALSGSPARRAVKVTANAALSLLGLGDTLKLWARRTTG
jgi:SAM-dependent methyltransferase